MREIFTAIAFAALAFVLARPASASEQWMRGSAAVLSAEPGVVLHEVGGALLGAEATAFPHYVSGLFNLRSPEEATIRVKTSNLIELYWTGPGFFAVERFDQFLDPSSEPEGDAEEGLSRMILNLRNGQLILDSSRLANASQLIVETPVGRLTINRAKWLMHVNYDEGSRLYDFSIECVQGRLSFTDRRGESYPLRAGQRLGGAGAAGNPAIEVSEVSDEALERIEDAGLAGQAEALAWVDWSRLVAQMEVLDFRLEGETEGGAAERGSEAGTRRERFILEYAPPAEPLTPYRGVVRPPTAYESDLF